MTLSPKKYLSHRGVEAKEVDIANTRFCSLKLEDASSSTCRAESSAASAREEREAREGREVHPRPGPGPPASSSPPPQPQTDDTASYLQVVVEKHRRQREAPPRLPAASSPRVPSPPPRLYVQAGDAGGACVDGVYTAPQSLQPLQPLLLACAAPAGAPLCAALQPLHAYTYHTRLAETRVLLDAGAGDARVPQPTHGTAPAPVSEQEKKKSKSWKLFREIDVDSLCDEGPECVEVYYFERGGGEFLAARAGARPGGCERASSRAARRINALFAELLAAPRLLAALPVAALVQAERAALLTARDALAGAVQTASDYALKPLLALLFNALAAPLLVCAGHAARGVRDTLVPLAQALDALVEPAARLLRAVRLVDVHMQCPHASHAP